jgi:glycosyltransferase involved in cell wall biosynthesis
MTFPVSTSDRVRVDGKFFRCGGRKFYVKGVTYGPFTANANGEMFPAPEQARRDLIQLRQLGANILRVYYVPPRWFLDLLHEHDLKVLVDIPWAKHLCFLDSPASRADARQTVRAAVAACKDHPAVFAYSVVNEISADIIRWSGVTEVQDFINELIAVARNVDPQGLFTFTSFPPTEFLQVDSADFVCFNVYLHDPKQFSGYLARLQTLADAKPLILGEFGMDSIREGEPHKCEFLAWQIELAFRAGLAGTVVFSYTDDWWRGGMQITDWGFGLTTRDRQPKDSFQVVQRQYKIAPHFALPRVPKVSVVVATYNGGRTLQNCLESLGRLNYADYEVILVDDGSTDRTPEIARAFSQVRYLRQSNQGLSAARNAGIRAAAGEIVAFTDDDCRADEDWLYYLVNDLLRSNFAGIGGHNFLPPEDSSIAAAVMASPGGPAHVLLTDTEAEHIPGCNMAFYKWALEEVGMFDPIFRKAGDDVDICWRLQDGQFKIGFSAAGFVWHYRRSTVKAYLKQQIGYGEAEALLIAKHPEHYSAVGGAIWHGRIYASSFAGLLLRGPAIYHGVFGSAFFQRLYAPNPVPPFLYCTSLGYHVFVNLPLLGLAFNFAVFTPLALASLALSFGACGLAAVQANLPPTKRRFWSRPLIALLFFLQPVVRSWARFKWRATSKSSGPIKVDSVARSTEVSDHFTFWSDGSHDRLQFLHAILDRLEAANWMVRPDTGWTTYDFEVLASTWVRLRFSSATEELEMGKRHFRCRLNSRWSTAARIVFVLLTGAVALMISLGATEFPWIWYSLLLLPLIGWFFESESAVHKILFARLLDEVGTTHKMVRLKM